MNNYQRIVINGQEIQPGAVDTHKKFRELLNGELSLSGKTVLDIGCNLGEMCRLACDAGAKSVMGIDCSLEYIRDARSLSAGYPRIRYEVQRAERATRNWDVAIASGVFHHDGLNLPIVLEQLARCAQLVVCDVWLNDRPNRLPDLLTTNGFLYHSERDTFVPTASAWAILAGRYFGSVVAKGPSTAPDRSNRWVYWLGQPKAKPAKAYVLYGQSGSGKTSLSKELERGEGFEHLQLDQIFVEWRITQERSEVLSVSDFVDEINKHSPDSWPKGLQETDTPPCASRTSYDRYKRYLAYHQQYIRRWLDSRQNLNVVIEGYDPMYRRYLSMVVDCLHEAGWSSVQANDPSGKFL